MLQPLKNYNEWRLIYFILLSPLLHVTATAELQRVETDLLHLVPAAGWILRSQHVCRCGGGELPQMPGVAGEGREGEARGETAAEARPETPT